MTFAEQLQAERKRLGMTRLHMAELLDVSARTVDYWETGKVVPQAVTQEGVLARTRAVTGVIDLTPDGCPKGVEVRKTRNMIGWTPIATAHLLKDGSLGAMKVRKPKKPAKRKPKA